ncbi:MAG: nuclear transport factor 2 family protein, partial [Acidobacteriota bacterium]
VWRGTAGCCAPNVARAVVKRYLQALSRGDIEAVLDLVEPGGRQVDVSGSRRQVDVETRRQRLAELCRAYRELDFRLIESWQTGQRIAFRWAASGWTRDGDEVTLRGLDMFELSTGGRVQRHWLDLQPERYCPAEAREAEAKTSPAPLRQPETRSLETCCAH